MEGEDELALNDIIYALRATSRSPLQQRISPGARHQGCRRFEGMSSARRTLITLTIVWTAFVLAGPAYAQETASGPAQMGIARIEEVTFDPPAPRTGARLKVNIRFGEKTVRAEVRWKVNDEDVEQYDYLGVTPSVELERPIRALDKIEVMVTPFDNEDVRGKEVVKRVSVDNASPTIKLVEQKIKGNVYQAKVDASDPEDELVSLTLEEAPPGMTMDQNGAIKWKFADNATGEFHVKVVARDKHGAEAILEYSFAIRREP